MQFIRYASKIVHERNVYLELFSLPQAIENARQFLLLRKDILQKQSLGAPECSTPQKHVKTLWRSYRSYVIIVILF